MFIIFNHFFIFSKLLIKIFATFFTSFLLKCGPQGKDIRHFAKYLATGNFFIFSLFFLITFYKILNRVNIQGNVR